MRSLRKAVRDLVGEKKHLSRYRLIFVIVLTLLVVFVAIFLIFYFSGNTKKGRDNEVNQKLNQLNEKEDLTCGDVVASVGDINSGEVNEPGSKISLLNRQMLCFADQGMVKEAIAAGEELKSVYESEGDNVAAGFVNNKLESLKQTQEELQKMESEEADDNPEQ